jgi:large subunit ribosomal protein L21
MRAVMKTGGKQYKVAAGDELEVEKLEAEAGQTIRFDEVLMIIGEDGAVTVGAPRVEGAAVEAEVVEHFRGPKTISFKRRRRKHSSARRKGHRQHLTRVRVTNVVAG